jgi:hypothetical protein
MDDQTAPSANQRATAEELERSLLADLLASSKLYHTTEDYQELTAFVSRLRNFAPFNAMLLQIQRPGLMYAASEYDWRTRFNRTLKEDARPLLILWPFGPVAFVYDKNDTEGDELPADVEHTFHATGPVEQTDLSRHIRRLAARGIHVQALDFGEGKAGYIQAVKRSTAKKERPDYQVRLNRNQAAAEQFTTLVHELGHLYLGHLGPDKYLKIDPRPALDHAHKEVEAESLAYLVCKRRGVHSKSATYLAKYVDRVPAISALDFYRLTKAAGQVETVLGIAAHTLFEPAKAVRDAQTSPQSNLFD